MTIAAFTAELTAIRAKALALLFDSIPEGVTYISLTVEDGEPAPDLYLDERGDWCQPGDAPEWEPLSQVFGHNISALRQSSVQFTEIPERVRNIITRSPAFQYGTGVPFVLKRTTAG